MAGIDRWIDIETAPTEVGLLHVRGLWVFSSETKLPLGFETLAGWLTDDGDFVDHDGNSPWRPEDYSHWLPLPPPPPVPPYTPLPHFRESHDG